MTCQRSVFLSHSTNNFANTDVTMPFNTDHRLESVSLNQFRDAAATVSPDIPVPRNRQLCLEQLVDILANLSARSESGEI